MLVLSMVMIMLICLCLFCSCDLIASIVSWIFAVLFVVLYCLWSSLLVSCVVIAWVLRIRENVDEVLVMLLYVEWWRLSDRWWLLLWWFFVELLSDVVRLVFAMQWVAVWSRWPQQVLEFWFSILRSRWRSVWLLMLRVGIFTCSGDGAYQM